VSQAAQAQAMPGSSPQQTNYGPGNYPAVSGAGQGGGNGAGNNGIAPLPPLAPPPSGATGQATISPFTPGQIVQMRKQFDKTRKAKAYRPVRSIPRISSVTVDLSPGASLPVARVMPGEMATVVFLDAGGAPWPLAAAPRVSDGRYFDAEWLKGTATVVISALSPYEEGNLSVMLQDFPTPVVIKLVTGEPDSAAKTRVVDYRLDLRIPGRAPGSPKGLVGTSKIALYDDTMQRFLDGIPPKPAKIVKASGTTSARVQVWALEGALFVRTVLDIQTAFDQCIAAGDGTRVYRLPPTPFVTLSDGGRSTTLQLDID
jgi:intracellular multiplication protein IcmK